MAQVFHWATAILVVVAFVYGPGGSEQRVYSVARDFDRQLHETLGLAVLSIVVLRLAWRAFDDAPDDPPMPAWMKVASTLVHATLYALLVGVPLTAWLPEAHALGSLIASVHTWLGDAILWVAGVHAAAALYHHFVLRDGVLRSMLPG
jgi:cytochrome b561